VTSLVITQLGWTLLNFIWEGALIAGLTGIGLALLRNSQPQARYILGCAALFACGAWPAADLHSRLSGLGAVNGEAATHVYNVSIGIAHDFSSLDWLHDHLNAIVLVWGTCVCFLGLRMAAGLWWISQAACKERSDSAWQARVTAMANRLVIDRTVSLRIVDSLAGPVTAGWWRPVVLLPSSLLTGMPPELLDALIAHELGHIKRADYLVNLLQNAIEAVLFYHPAVWWLSRLIRIEREHIADDLATQLVDERLLALALSELEKHQFSKNNLVLAANGGHLIFRIRRLLQPEKAGVNWKGLLSSTGLTVVLVAGCAQMNTTSPVATSNVSIQTAAMHTKAIVEFASCAHPAWPAESLRNGHTGTVILDFLVDESGKVSDSRINRSSGDVFLDEAARLSIAKCTFVPATKKGVRVKGWSPLKYVWALK
jgi:bla regulator protein BlaR1